MRKHRSWLMGLGIGLIIGASMLQLILLAQDQAVMVAREPISREQLNEEAKKAGLVLLTEEQLNTRVEEAVAASQEETESNNGENEGIDDSNTALKPPGASATPSATPSDPEKAEQPEASASPEKEKEKVTLYVSYGMSLTEVAIELEKLGVIDDADNFIKKARDIAKRMTVGNAEFTGKPTYQEIMNELTRKK